MNSRIKSISVLICILLILGLSQSSFAQMKYGDGIKPAILTHAVGITSTLIIVNAAVNEGGGNIGVQIGYSYFLASLLSTTIFSKDPLRNFFINGLVSTIPLGVSYYTDGSRMLFAFSSALLIPIIHIIIYSNINSNFKIKSDSRDMGVNVQMEMLPCGNLNTKYTARVIHLEF
ncbi:hypothetical protein KAR48_12900 [bacterium]|nr:hypothetical protein [bacterium]